MISLPLVDFEKTESIGLFALMFPLGSARWSGLCPELLTGLQDFCYPLVVSLSSSMLLFVILFSFLFVSQTSQVWVAQDPCSRESLLSGLMKWILGKQESRGIHVLDWDGLKHIQA